MQSQNRFFDDLARVAQGAFGTLNGLRDEVEALVKGRFERLIDDFDLVTREEFDAVKAVAAAARAEQETLLERVAALEARLEAVEKAAKPAARPRRAQTGPAAQAEAAPDMPDEA